MSKFQIPAVMLMEKGAGTTKNLTGKVFERGGDVLCSVLFQ